ncbi:hypothetical protein ACCO45_008457 [Purpureocillium lilacinum]|uniref:Uncharacterized protein n=1 Tax=Purpureocillium lilacinum TaxID=33203 RepID=A0ACC4DPS6_PURLI
MIDSRSRLPAEIMVTILDYLPVADQIRMARTSRRLQEMVYDDTRWVSRLKSMGCWDEREARRRFEEAVRRRREAAERAAGQQPDGATAAHKPGETTLFDASVEEQKRRHDPEDADSYLDVFKSVKSIRGGARQEYGKIYDAGQPQEVLEKRLAPGRAEREEKLASMTGIFESAVRYAHVLHTLGGARGGIELFIHKHPIFHDRDLTLNPVECINMGPTDNVSLEPARRFQEVLLAKVNDQAGVIERIFPEPAAVFWEFVDKVREDIIMEYTTPLFDECHERSIASYLKAVSGVFEQTMRFFQTLTPPQGSHGDINEKAKDLTLRVFEPHLDLYLQEELDFFTKQAETEVSQWEKKLSEQDSSLESFYMANFNRSAEKKDFLSSFKKVVMMPVTVLLAFQ